MRAAAFLALGLAAGAVCAEAPERSVRPEARPSEPAVTVQRPRLVQPSLSDVVGRSPRPPARPENLRRRAAVAAAGFRRTPPATGSRGALCGDPAIQGVRMSPIAGRIRGCGVNEPVRVASVSGVELSSAATLDCATAKALNAWVRRGVVPVVGRLGGGVAGLKVAAHYSCRTRNNRAGAEISEHGRGRAIDISAIVLRNGTALTVLNGWRDRGQAGMFRTMHRAACGHFGTVLGPDADRYHQDHFHFDTARHRGGTYCR